MVAKPKSGSIMISPIPFVTPNKTIYATLHYQVSSTAILMDELRNEIEGNQVS
jgi:acetyl-CoA synthetase